MTTTIARLTLITLLFVIGLGRVQAQQSEAEIFWQIYQQAKSQGDDIPDWLHAEIFGPQSPEDVSRSSGGNPGEAVFLTISADTVQYSGNSNNPGENSFGLRGCRCIPEIDNQLNEDDLFPETGATLSNQWFKRSEDWYSFTLNGETNFWMSTCVKGQHNNFDTAIAVLNENMDVVAMNDDWYKCEDFYNSNTARDDDDDDDDDGDDDGDDNDEDECLDLNSALRVTLPSGTYYAIVGGYQRERGEYTVEFSFLQGITAGTDSQPRSLSLNQNSPNPFNPSTRIEFSLKESADVHLNVYDIQGSEVAELINGPMARGSHQVSFDGTGMSSGVYFYVLDNSKSKESRKMVLVR